MILTCPQCATRYQVDGTKFPTAGRNVRCAKCGNVWHQLGPVPEPDPEAEIMVEEPPAVRRPAPPEPSEDQPRVAAFVAPQEMETAADSEELVERRPRRSWLGRIAIAFGWLILIGLVLVIGWAAVNFRENVAMLVPQTTSLYAAAGLPVAPRGMDFIGVGYHQQTEDGQGVLVVTGQIVNRSSHELSVPPVRVTLLDADRHELYSWNFVAPVSTLKPGATTKFHTRLSSPPHETHNLEVRFARAGE
jgi:predicted Zn finger-like uncharacterized protein